MALRRDIDNAIRLGGIARLALGAAETAARPSVRAAAVREGARRERDEVQPFLGGITLREAEKMFDDFKRFGELAKKKLFKIIVSDSGNDAGGAILSDGSLEVKVEGGITNQFAFYAIDVSYSPYTVSSEKRRIGSITADTVQSGDPVEMRVITYDDMQGSLKRWFRRQCDLQALQGRENGVKVSGLVGLPGQYSFKVKIMHAFHDDGRPESNVAYVDEFIMRTGQIDFDLRRDDSGPQELSMTFIEVDAFMRP